MKSRPSISVSPRWWPKPEITRYPQSIPMKNHKTHTTEKQCKSIKRNKAILFRGSSHESGHCTGPENVKWLAIFPLPEQWVFPWDLPGYHQVMETVKDWNPENRNIFLLDFYKMNLKKKQQFINIPILLTWGICCGATAGICPGNWLAWFGTFIIPAGTPGMDGGDV